MKKPSRPQAIRSGVFLLLLLLSITGGFTWLQREMLVDPAREITDVQQTRSVEHGEVLDSLQDTVNLYSSDGYLSCCGKVFDSVRDALGFSRAILVLSTIILHIVNIFLIISLPVGLVLLAILFLILIILVFHNGNRLRNAAMATGIAAYFFVLAIPLAVLLSGQLAGFYTSAFRFGYRHNMEEFGENLALLEADVAADENFQLDRNRIENKLTMLQKGIPGYTVAATATWLLDLAILPVLLAWMLYRLGILASNTLFGSFRVQKMGKALKGMFERLQD